MAERIVDVDLRTAWRWRSSGAFRARCGWRLRLGCTGCAAAVVGFNVTGARCGGPRRRFGPSGGAARNDGSDISSFCCRQAWLTRCLQFGVRHRAGQPPRIGLDVPGQAWRQRAFAFHLLLTLSTAQLHRPHLRLGGAFSEALSRVLRRRLERSDEDIAGVSLVPAPPFFESQLYSPARERTQAARHRLDAATQDRVRRLPQHRLHGASRQERQLDVVERVADSGGRGPREHAARQSGKQFFECEVEPLRPGRFRQRGLAERVQPAGGAADQDHVPQGAIRQLSGLGSRQGRDAGLRGVGCLHGRPRRRYSTLRREAQVLTHAGGDRLDGGHRRDPPASLPSRSVRR